MCFVYFTMYDMIFVAITPSYHIAQCHGHYLLCYNIDPIDLYNTNLWLVLIFSKLMDINHIFLKE